MIYEITYLTNPQTDYAKTSEEVKKTLEELKLKQAEPLNSPFTSAPRRLGYGINHQISGYYHTLRFIDENKNVDKLEKELKFNKNIVRYIVVKLPKEAMDTKKITEKVSFGPVKKTAETAKKLKEKNKVKIEELDKKLDEILDNNIM